MLGFEFLKNFDSPYKAESITDFWRRWHISLSTFLRDYLYIPLGGNRKGPWRTYVNLILVMLLGGLWHGAKLDIRRLGGVSRDAPGLRAIPRQAQRFPTMAAARARRGHVRPGAFLVGSVSLGESARGASATCGSCLGREHPAPGRCSCPPFCTRRERSLIMAIAAVVVAWPIQAHEWSREVTLPKAVLVHPLFCASLLVMFSQSFNPFLYFQF